MSDLFPATAAEFLASTAGQRYVGEVRRQLAECRLWSSRAVDWPFVLTRAAHVQRVSVPADWHADLIRTIEES